MAPHPRSRANTAPCRCSRASRPPSASRPSCWRGWGRRWCSCWPAAGWAAARRWRPACCRWPSRTTSSTPRSPPSTRPSPSWRWRWASVTGSRCARRAGRIDHGRRVRHRPGGQAQRLADADLPASGTTSGCGGTTCWAARTPPGRRRRIPPIPLVFLSMAVLGPLVFFLHWPKLWVDPVGHTPLVRAAPHCSTSTTTSSTWAGTGTTRPRSGTASCVRMTFPFVSTALTVPVTTLALAAAGRPCCSLRRARRRRQARTMPTTRCCPTRRPPTAPAAPGCAPAPTSIGRPGAFLFVQMLGPLAVLAVPSTPIFGGVKHFMPAMPYLAIVAGGRAALADRASSARPAPRSRPRAGAAGAARGAWRRCVCLPALVETRRSHPDGLSPLQPPRRRLRRRRLAGHEPPVLGLLGAAHARLDRRQRCPPAARIYWHDVFTDAAQHLRARRPHAAGIGRRRHRRGRGGPAPTSASSSTSVTSCSTRRCSGRPTAPPGRPTCAPGRACPSSPPTSARSRAETVIHMNPGSKHRDSGRAHRPSPPRAASSGCSRAAGAWPSSTPSSWPPTWAPRARGCSATRSTTTSSTWPRAGWTAAWRSRASRPTRTTGPASTS